MHITITWNTELGLSVVVSQFPYQSRPASFVRDAKTTKLKRTMNTTSTSEQSGHDCNCQHSKSARLIFQQPTTPRNLEPGTTYTNSLWGPPFFFSLALHTWAVSFTLKNMPREYGRKDTNQRNVTLKSVNLTWQSLQTIYQRSHLEHWLSGRNVPSTRMWCLEVVLPIFETPNTYTYYDGW